MHSSKESGQRCGQHCVRLVHIVQQQEVDARAFVWYGGYILNGFAFLLHGHWNSCTVYDACSLLQKKISHFFFGCTAKMAIRCSEKYEENIFSNTYSLCVQNEIFDVMGLESNEQQTVCLWTEVKRNSCYCWCVMSSLFGMTKCYYSFKIKWQIQFGMNCVGGLLLLLNYYDEWMVQWGENKQFERLRAHFWRFSGKAFLND